MMKRTQKTVLALIASIGIGAMAASYATGMGMGPGEGCALAGKKMANPAQIDSKLVEMKKILKIGSAQEEAWTTFATIMKRQKTEMMSVMQEEKMQQRTSKEHPAQAAPDRIDERIQFMKQRVAGMETAAAAMKQLYAILTPQQRKILNERIGQNVPISF